MTISFCDTTLRQPPGRFLGVDDTDFTGFYEKGGMDEGLTQSDNEPEV